MELIWISHLLSKWRFPCSLSGHMGLANYVDYWAENGFVSFYVVFFEFVGLAWSKWVASSRVGNPSFGLGFWFLWCGWWPCWLGDEVWEKDLGITYNLCFPIELMDNLPTSESFLFNKIAIPMKTIDFQSTILFIIHWRRIVEIFLGLFNQKFEKWYKSWTHLNIIFQSIKLKKNDKK